MFEEKRRISERAIIASRSDIKPLRSKTRKGDSGYTKGFEANQTQKNIGNN